MNLDPLARRLYPRLPPGRRAYQLKVLLASALVGFVLGAVMVAVLLAQAAPHGELLRLRGGVLALFRRNG